MEGSKTLEEGRRKQRHVEARKSVDAPSQMSPVSHFDTLHEHALVMSVPEG